MSATVRFSTPNTTALSASATVTAWPSFMLTVRLLPSSLSTDPTTRIGVPAGGVWARAGRARNRINSAALPVYRMVGPPLQRRFYAILLGGHSCSGQGAVSLLLGSNENRGPRLQQAGVGRDIADDRNAVRNGDLGLVAFEGNLHDVPLRRAGDLRQCRVGHDAVGRKIPGQLGLGDDAAQILGDDMNLDRLELAVGALERGRSDKISGLDVGEAFGDAAGYREVRGQRDGQGLAVARFDHQNLAVELVDGAANARRRAFRRVLSRGRQGEQRDEDASEI